MSLPVVVVGGGLSGLSAAHTLLQGGANVVIIDKNPILGGNSTKATSGINGAGTSVQKKLGVPDTKEIFEEDTARSATGIMKGPAPTGTDLGRTLTHDSAGAVEWLIDDFKLPLDTVSRLGGHSQPRTHRSKSGGTFPGMMITYRLMQDYEEICDNDPSRAKLITRARVNKLHRDADGKVVALEYEQGGKQHRQDAMAVVVATGGFGAGVLFPGSLLEKLRPDLMHLPTTNGSHCTGDGIEFARDAGADCVDLKEVQVHPTGLVHPDHPDERTKFLAAGALRGEGAIILNRHGKRFCDELGKRDYVSGMMFKNEAPFFLVLNKRASDNIDWHCRHYTGRGVMRKLQSGDELAKFVGVPKSALKATFDEFNHAAKVNKDPHGRRFFSCHPWTVNDEYYHVAIITPIVHYCMGGLKINTSGAVLEAGSGKPIKGLFAAGEVTGGVHGKNRLGGSALLECVVFGRACGAAINNEFGSQYRRSGSGGGGNGTVTVTVTQPDGRQIVVQIDGNGAVSSGSGAVAAAPAAAAASQVEEAKEKVYTLAEVAKHTTEDDCWVVVNGQVLDVTSFLEDHPGGKMAILTFAGRDASEEFNMLHDKNVIEKYAPECVIGVCKELKSKL